MAGLKKPTHCTECRSLRLEREWQPERWVCLKCKCVVVSRKAKPQTGICRDCGRSNDETPFASWGNICLECKKKYNKNYGEENREAIKEHHRQYYQENKGKVKASVRKAVQRSPEAFLRNLWHHIRKTSNYKRKHRKKAILICEISYEYLLDLWESQKGCCALTGIPMVHVFNSMKTISVDRIDSSKGYVPGNVQLVCKWVNLAKQDGSNKEMKQIIAEAFEAMIQRAEEDIRAGRVISNEEMFKRIKKRIKPGPPPAGPEPTANVIIDERGWK